MSLKTKIPNLRTPAIICALLLLCSHASAGGIEDIRVLKISPEDGRAVVRTADGKMKVIKVGDSIAKQTVVIEIAQERVVLKEQKDNEPETVIIRLENGVQRVERLKKAGEQRPQLYAPGPAPEGKGNERSQRGKKKESSFN